MSRESVDKGHAEWMAAMRANDAAALGGLVTDDAVLMPPHQQPVIGRQGVVDWFEGIVKQARTVAISVPQREVIITESYGIERGSYTWKMAPTGGGSHIEERGNFLALWHREPDGSWKVCRNIWNSTLPPQG